MTGPVFGRWNSRQTRRRPWAGAVSTGAVLLIGACSPKPASVPSTPMQPGAPIGGGAVGSNGAQYPQAQYPQAQYPQAQYPQAQYPQAQYPQGTVYPPTTPVQPGTPSPGGVSGLATAPLTEMRRGAERILGELVSALPSNYQQRVTGIPLVVDSTVGEINAFAACDSKGRSAMAITDGLLQVAGVLAQAAAHDELLGTRKVDEYIQQCATELRPNRPVPSPAAGTLSTSFDARIGQRADQLFEETVGFILGHELGHHYLGHLPCTAADGGAGEVARVLSSAVPLFNQPNEIAADVAGTNNLLTTGRTRSGRGLYGWTEAGGLLSMRFFSGFEQLTPDSVLLSFQHSHPAPQLRIPIIQQAAATWRATGGAGLPVLGL